MEILSNLAWLAVSVFVFALTASAIRRKTLRVPNGVALVTALVLCLVLLPVISMTDDLMENRQASLPLASQSWHLASEASSIGLEAISLTSGWMLFLALAFAAIKIAAPPVVRQAHYYVAWLARAQRLRPPPFCAI